MTKLDMCSCPVTLSAQESVAHWNGVIHGLLSHGQQTLVHLGKLMEAEPEFAMGHAARGLFCLITGRAEVLAPARDALTAARDAANHTAITPREQGWIDALALWLDGRPTAAIAAVEAVLRALPHDTLSASISANETRERIPAE